jgi:hypothetical protein
MTNKTALRADIPEAEETGEPEAATAQKPREPDWDGQALTLEYVRDMSRQLSDLARNANSPTLAYLLAMAEVEAEEAVNVNVHRTELYRRE